MANSDGIITISGKTLKRLFVLLLALAVIGGVGLLGWKYTEQSKANQRAQEDIQRLSDPAEAAKEAEEKLIEEIKKVALVPGDERPTIANVTDANQLKGQVLFNQIENGDKVFLYTKARRQVVYRPSTKQVITLVTLPEDTTAQPSAETQPAPAQ